MKYAEQFKQAFLSRAVQIEMLFDGATIEIKTVGMLKKDIKTVCALMQDLMICRVAVPRESGIELQDAEVLVYSEKEFREIISETLKEFNYETFFKA